MNLLKLSVTTLILCFTISALAQRTELTVLAGLSSSIMRENGDKDPFGRRYAGHAGLLFGVGSENVLFETGLLYSSRGTNFATASTFPGASGWSVTSLSMHFIDIPAMLVVSPSNFRFFIGPQLSFLTKAAYEDKKLSSEELKNTFEKTTVGLRYGIGLDLRRLVLQIHFINGLSDIYKDSSKNWKNNAYQFGVGYNLVNSSKPLQNKKGKDSVVPHRVLD